MGNLIKLGLASLGVCLANFASGASLSTPPYLALGLDPYLGSSLRSGVSVELINYPSAQYALGYGVAAGLTLLHRETIYEAVFLVNHLRGTDAHGLNFKLTAGIRSFNHEEVSRDLGISYAIPMALPFVTRIGVLRRKAKANTMEEGFLYKEKKRSDATEVVLSMELISGRLDR